MIQNISSCANWLKVFLILLVFSLFAESCHSPLHLFGKRRKRNVNSTMTDRTFMPSCLQRLSNRSLTWQGPVDYVILHSAWYSNTSNLCSETLNTDTPECWLQNINSLIFANSSLLNEVKQCIVEYTFETRGTNYTGSMFPSEEIESPFDDDLCPEVNDNDFFTDFSSQTFGVTLEIEDDETITNIGSVVTLMQTDIICPSCTCLQLSENVGALEEFDFQSGIECNRCWPSRIASLARRRSRLARPFGVAAIMIENLQPVNNCSSRNPLNFDDPELENNLNIQVECRSNGIDIRADRCTLINLGIIFLNEFVVANPERSFLPTTELEEGCTPTIFDNPDRTNVRFTIRDLSFCEPQIMINGTHITYAYFLRVVVNDDAFRGPITRIGNYIFNFNCTYGTNYSLASNVSLFPMLGTTTISIKDRPGTFDITLRLFRDMNYTQAFMSGGTMEQRTVTVPNKVHVSVDVETSTSTVFLLVSRCFASNSIPAVPIASYTLINNECPVELSVRIVNESNPRQVRFNFESFAWTNPELTQQIFITCFVRICDTNAEPCRKKECARKKRSVDMKHKTKEIVVGPLLVKKKKKYPCIKDNGGCSHICLPDGDFRKCACRSGYMLMSDERNCLEETLQSNDYYDNEERTSPNRSSNSIMFVFVLIVFCLTMLNIIIYLKGFQGKWKKQIF